ncbi:hypothetical protein GCM10028803_02800 [Larkinella knui]
MACSKRYTLTANLNNSYWFASGEATEIHTEENKTCLTDRFSIIVRTDLPFSPQSLKVTPKVTGCVGQCTPTQMLGFYQLPLKKGYYNLALPDTCLPTKTAKSETSFTVAIATLHVMDTQMGSPQKYYQFKQGDKGWVKVTKLNRAAGKVKGQFDVTLTGPDGQSIHLKSGKFSSKLITQ